MPELPEVETIKRQLAKDIIGKKITRVKILSAKQFIGEPDDIVGGQIINVWRRAKLLGIELNNGFTILIHLKLTGQFVFVAGQKKATVVKISRSIPFADNKLPARTTRIVVRFADGSWLFFNDLRKSGWMKVIENSKFKIKNLPYGPEPLGKKFTVGYLSDVFSRTRRAIKIVLMGQKKIAGIGNIYANEALFEAKINPCRSANSLDNSEIGHLRQAIIKVLRGGIKYGGTSAADDAYIRPDATRGRYQQKLKVYQREGKPCLNCGGKVLRIKQGGRSTFFCPVCQK